VSSDRRAQWQRRVKNARRQTGLDQPLNATSCAVRKRARTPNVQLEDASRRWTNRLAFEPRYGTFVLKGVLPAGSVFPFDTSVSCRPLVPRTATHLTCSCSWMRRWFSDASSPRGSLASSNRSKGVIDAEQTEDGGDRAQRLIARRGRELAAHGSIHTLSDLSQDLVAQIEHFIVSYNEMKGSSLK
jgi:inorganic pyrophosphatase